MLHLFYIRYMKKLIFLLLIIPLISFGQIQDQLGSNKPASENLNVMSYNIWNGFDWGKDTLRKKNCIRWIKDKNPDVLALQELTGYDEEKLKADAEKWGHNYVKILKKDGKKEQIETNKSTVDVLVLFDFVERRK